MKTITVRADREFDTLLTQMARRMNTTRSGVIREAVRRYQQEIEREALRRQLRDASLLTRAQAKHSGEELSAANSDGL